MKSRWFQGVLIGATAAIAALSIGPLGPVRTAEHVTWDWRVRSFRDADRASPEVKLILLDQGSLDYAAETLQVGWPWPRELHGAIVDFCTDGDAKAVLLDVTYLEAGYVDQDTSLAEAIGRSKRTVTAAWLGDDVIPAKEPLPERLTIAVQGWDTYGETLDAAAMSSTSIRPPIPPIASASARIGNVKKTERQETVVRRQGLFQEVDGVLIPSLALAGLLVGEGEPGLALEPGWLMVGDRRVPLDGRGRTVLRYHDTAAAYDTVSADAVIESQMRRLEGAEPILDPSWCKGAYVLFGYSAPGLLDLRPTPLSPVAPGVLIHATLLDNLLQGEAMNDAAPPFTALVVVLLALAAGVAMRYCWRARHTVYAFAGLVPLAMAPGWIGYATGWWIPVGVPLAAVLLALVGGLIVNYALEGKDRAFIKRAFEHYLSPLVIEQILEDPSRLRLGGERRELSIFFSDLKGFSTISEQLDPVDVTALLNDFLTEMTEIVHEEQGTLDKYEGDAIIAFWNAPLDDPHHAQGAVRAAIRCQRRLAECRASYRERSGHDLYMRIGIHTGPVVVGNMGSHDRFDYSMLGDAANLAARLEGANKPFGTGIMVSEATWEQCGGAFVGRCIGRLRVVGRDTPVRVFEPLGMAGGHGRPDTVAYDEALASFEAGDLEVALARFERLAGDPLADAYAGRCREELESGDEGWEPVWNLASK